MDKKAVKLHEILPLFFFLHVLPVGEDMSSTWERGFRQPACQYFHLQMDTHTHTHCKFEKCDSQQLKITVLFILTYPCRGGESMGKQICILTAFSAKVWTRSRQKLSSILINRVLRYSPIQHHLHPARRSAACPCNTVSVGFLISLMGENNRGLCWKSLLSFYYHWCY